MPRKLRYLKNFKIQLKFICLQKMSRSFRKIVPKIRSQQRFKVSAAANSPPLVGLKDGKFSCVRFHKRKQKRNHSKKYPLFSISILFFNTFSLHLPFLSLSTFCFPSLLSHVSPLPFTSSQLGLRSSHIQSQITHKKIIPRLAMHLSSV